MVAVRLLVCACVVWSGCVYIDPIRRHSDIELSPAPGMPVERGSNVQITATMDNPGHFEWQVFACSDPFGQACNETPLVHPIGSSNMVTFVANVRVSDDDTSALTQSIVVSLRAWDDRGALAIGAPPRAWYPVTNAAPTVTVTRPVNATVGVPLEVFAQYGDTDDSLESAEVKWRFSSPQDMGLADLEDIPKVADGASFIAGKRFTPLVAGNWQINVDVDDSFGAHGSATVDFAVGPDRPPCIAQWSPIVPTGDAALPITEPSLFQIPVVTDELDSYPRSSTAPRFGTATFAWSVLVPGGAREVLAGATGNAVELDPNTFRLGDVIELRVEVFDRNQTPSQCADAAPTCSASTPSCLQRLTWRLEVR